MKKILLPALLTLLVLINNLFGQCPPPGYPTPGDTCPQAALLCQDLNGYCDILNTNNINQPFPGCPANALNNDEWFTFIAGSTTINILVTPSNCQGTFGQFGMQGAIYEGACGGTPVATQCGCTQSPFNLFYTNFIPGQIYYIVFDGCAGDICDYVVNVTQGSTIPQPPQPPGGINGPISVCPGSSGTYSVPNPNAATFNWTLTPPGVGSFTTPPTGSPVSINWNTTGMAQLCVTSSTPCYPPGAPVCVTINSQNLPPNNLPTQSICFNQCVTCAGVFFCNPGAPPSQSVTLTNYLGCDSVVVCNLNSLQPIQTNLGQVTLCGPNLFLMCGQPYTNSGIFSTSCTSYQGCDSTVLVDLAILMPQAVVQPPPLLPCGGVLTLSGVGSTWTFAPGVSTTFQWTGPGLLPPTNDISVNINQPGQYCLTITQSRNGVICTSSACVTVFQDNAVPPAPQLSGNQNPCQGAVVNYTVNPTGNPLPSGYNWTTPNGEPVVQLNSNTFQITWNNPNGGQLCVTATNGCGASPPACIPITVTAAPSVPQMTGPTSACANATLQTYTISPTQPGVTYNWTVPAGASYTGSGASINVNYSGAMPGTGQVCVTGMNACGTSQPACVTVNITTPPVTPTMSGPSTVCASGGNYTFNVTNAVAGNTYNWTAPPSATISGSGASVMVDFNGSNSGQVCVTASNNCGNSNQTCQSVTVDPAPTANISGSGSFCQGSGGTVNLTITLTGNGPWDVTYTIDAASPTTINITTSPYTLVASQPGTYVVTAVTGANNCPGTVSGSATVMQNPSPTAALSGSGSICQGSGQQASLLIDMTGTPPWTVNWAVNGNAQAPLVINTTPYNLMIGQAQAGNITLTGITDANGCIGTTSGSASVVVNTAPMVSMIQDSCNNTNTAYYISFVIAGGDPATYSVTGGAGTLLPTPPYTFISAPIPTGSPYSFTVNDVNNCNPTTLSDVVICDCATEVGLMDLTLIEECGNGPVMGIYDANGEFLDGNDVRVFVLHSGNGVTIVPPIVGTNSTPTFSFNPGTMTYGTTYYLSAVVGDDDGSGSVNFSDPCRKVSQGTPVVFYEIPTATLSGNPAVCAGSPATFSVAFTGVSPWSISYDDGSGNIQTLNGITSNPYNLVVNPGASSTYCLTAASDNHCTGTFSGCGNVTVNTAVQVSNIQDSCNATSTAYILSFTISGGDPASYSVTGVTGSISGGPPYVFTSNPIPTGTGYNVTVTDANNCGPQTVSKTLVVCNCTTDAGTMNLTPVSVCGNGPQSVPAASGTVFDGDDVLLYYMHTSLNNNLGTVIATNTSPSFSFNAATMTYGTTYYISAVVGNSDGAGGIDLTDPCLDVAPGTPIVFHEIPTANLSGGVEICPGGSATLIVDLTGDSPWSIVINGQTITGIVGSPYAYTVSPASTTTYTLTAVQDEFCGGTVSGAETVTVHSPPTAGAPVIDCNDTGDGFTVCFTINGGDPSCYQVTPPNGTITGDQFCSNELPDGQGFLFNVSDCHGCPAVIVQDPFVDCTCLSRAGDMTGTLIEVCGASATATANYDNTNEVFDADDVVCFLLRNPANGAVIATNPTSPTFNFLPGSMTLGQTYEICAAVGNPGPGGCVDLNHPCTHIGGCVPVVFYALPTASLSGTASICTGKSTNLSVALTGTAPWTVVYQNIGGNPVTLTANNSPLQIPVSPANSTIYSLVSVQDAHCAGTVSGTASITVNQAPTVINDQYNCDATSTTYQVTFQISGGNPATYFVLPAGSGTLSGNTFTSNAITSGQSVTFTVDDANGCGPVTFVANFNCACLSNAGTMDGPLVSFCTNETAIVPPTQNPFLDANDVLIYVLHTANNTSLGTVLATNTTPQFTFNPGTMQSGVTYYISAVVGNNNGSGGVDPNDPCRKVELGIPVRFFVLPTISISGTTSICEGDAATVTLTMTGVGPHQVDYLLNGIPQTPLLLPTGQFTINLTPPQTTTVTLVSILDTGTGCGNNSSQSATITVNPSVEAGTALGDLAFCKDQDQVINLNAQLTGADPGGQWTGPSGPIPGGSVNTTSLTPGSYTFTYTVVGTPPCPNDQASFQLTLHPVPVADAGTDKNLDCDNTQATLGGSATTPGISYSWTGGNVSDPESPTPITTQPGTYTLQVTNSFGCSASDVVVITQTVTNPIPHITITDISCFGRNDGFIVIDSVTNGVPPYLYSFNGSAFSTQKSFTNLNEGSYSIVILDAAGCESTLTTVVVDEPQEVTVEIKGNFEGDDPVVQLGESVVLVLVTNPPFNNLDSVHWFPPELVPCDTCQSNEVTPTKQTTFTVVVEKNGCKDEDKITIFIKKSHPVYVPNAFSPNDDLINDLFEIFPGPTLAKVKSFLVFNRWGESVFEYYNFFPGDPAAGWDGTHRGEKLNPGVFTWFAEVEFIDGLIEVLEGDVILLR